MREYVPDNLERFVIYESELERSQRLKDRADHEWGMADNDRDDWEDWINSKRR